MRRLIKLFITVLLLTFSHLSIASHYYGITYSTVAANIDIPDLNGHQLYLIYDPQCFQWRQFNVYFDFGAGHFWTKTYPHFSGLNVYAISPVIRNTFKKRGPIYPFLELSIGASYLNHTRIQKRNLGMHFAFQDRLGLGFFIGSKQQISLGMHVVHYSNAHLSERNSGLSTVEADLGYRFS